jgi:hypothetical protein
MLVLLMYGCRTRRPMSSSGYLLCHILDLIILRPHGVTSHISCSFTTMALSHGTEASHTVGPVYRGHVARLKQRVGPKLAEHGGYVAKLPRIYTLVNGYSAKGLVEAIKVQTAVLSKKHPPTYMVLGPAKWQRPYSPTKQPIPHFPRP